MKHAINLEKRKFGIYYFRQTIHINNKQIVKRISLRTKDIVIAKFLALQIKARIEMIDLKKIKKYDITFDENNNIKTLKVNDDNDQKNLIEFLTVNNTVKAEEHKRQIEKLKLENEIKDKQKFADSDKGQEIIGLYQKLNDTLPVKNQTNDINSKSLVSLKDEYIENSNVTAGTKYKYEQVISKLIFYADTVNVKTADKIDRKFTYSYLIYLRKTEKKSDKTIKNIFNTLSSFYNHLVIIGEIVAPNPFIAQKLDVEDSERKPFSNDELEIIFSSSDLKSNEKLFFICLLLLTTAARPNEICQLWTDDIKLEEENGIYTIRITENKERGQTVKTKSSNRLIYLNQLLIEFGFIEYLKKQKLGMIFDLKKPTSKTYSTFISEEFTKLLRSLGIKEKTMYCFRHTANNRLYQNKVNREVRENLTGHQNESMNVRVYSQAHEAKLLKDDTEEILQYREIQALKK